jgi:5-methylcytosine-specific restriction endonuclease McrA
VSQLLAELLNRTSSLDELVDLLAELSGRTANALRLEMAEHLATRICFLLMGEAREFRNYSEMESKLSARFRVPVDQVEALAGELAKTMAWIAAADVCRKDGLRDLPYPIRRQLFTTQNNRCAICGWCFADVAPPWRHEKECEATLDHRVPFRLGGSRIENLWILCALCNALKGAHVHVGENGQVWSNNHVYYDGPRTVAFWTIRRDGKCRSCDALPKTARLRVRRKHAAGAWVADNCETVCSAHENEGGALDF